MNSLRLTQEGEYMHEVQYFGTHPFDQISIVCGGLVRKGAQAALR
jgi:hypothetical protein